MRVEDEIRKRLAETFDAAEITVVNESGRHAGHAGDDGSGESHFRVAIRSPAFAGMGRIDRHRAVHAALGDLTRRIHALALSVEV